jgi:hypothetical protein
MLITPRIFLPMQKPPQKKDTKNLNNSQDGLKKSFVIMRVSAVLPRLRQLSFVCHVFCSGVASKSALQQLTDFTLNRPPSG